MLRGAWLTGLILFDWAAWAASIAPLECEDVSAEVPMQGSNLLQVQVSRGEDHFGPGDCVSLSRSSVGTCVLKTKCPISTNISDVEFAFVCSNPHEAMPHALHSFGRGGFEAEEMFDTGVKCKSCLSVETAYRTGSPLMRNALSALPQGRLAARSMPGAHLPGALVGPGIEQKPLVDIDTFEPEEVTHFGPKACVSTFQAPSGSCLIRTRCKGVDMSGFNVGVTCLDTSGGYTRYLFGKDVFQATETFDSQLQCFKCLGVGAESSVFAAHSALPKQLMEDVGSLKTDVDNLAEQVRLLAQSTQLPVPVPQTTPRKESLSDNVSHTSHSSHGTRTTRTSQVKDEKPGYEDIVLQDEVRIPTIMVERFHSAATVPGETQQGPSEALLVVRHQRAPVIAELLRRIQRSHVK